MKNNGLLFITLAIVALGFSVYAVKTSHDLRTENAALLEKLSGADQEANEEYELAKAMFYMQWHSGKLWFAGKNQNWELAAFYAHEVEETIEEIEEAQVEEDGHDISTLVHTMTLPFLEQVEEAIEKKDVVVFESAYKNLVQSCNACHQVTGKPFIKITIPEVPFPGNQDFTKD
ncbi:MAG: hypothetical protein JJU28_17575 [Cyclobacteriaceae bacterium]|nr:hypothetical protein [Cyclobacteriaceae bacterium]